MGLILAAYHYSYYNVSMKKIGPPITIRIDDDALAIARRLAEKQKKPLRTLLREIVEEVLRSAE